MKKILSVVLAVMMTVSVLTVSGISAMAAISPTASTAKDKDPTIQVNGSDNDTDVSYTVDPNDPSTIRFSYDGEGELIGWETNLEELGYVEGIDYTLKEYPDGDLEIKFINPDALEDFYDGDVIVNALVDMEGEENNAKKNGSNKSPHTGIATSVIAGSVAIAGAGFAVLSATKKKDAE